MRRAQEHARRCEWLVKTDVQAYFDSIHHDIVLTQLERRFKDPGLLALCERIVRSYHTQPGLGLPIGALYSQHFANHHLAEVDRQCQSWWATLGVSVPAEETLDGGSEGGG